MKVANKKSLSEMYNVSLKTLHSWLRPFENEIGPYTGKGYTPKQLEIIYNRLGKPESKN